SRLRRVQRPDQCVGQTGIADVIWHGARGRDVGGGTHGPIITVFGWRSWNERVQLDGAGAMMRASAARCTGGGDGEPLAHVEGEADDLAEIAAEAGASVQGGTPRCGAPAGN